MNGSKKLKQRREKYDTGLINTDEIDEIDPEEDRESTGTFRIFYFSQLF